MISNLRFGHMAPAEPTQTEVVTTKAPKTEQPKPEAKQDSVTISAKAKSDAKTAAEKKEAEEALKRMQTAKLNVPSAIATALRS